MGIRTPDLLIANETLYQLSYDPTQSRREFTKGLATLRQAQRRSELRCRLEGAGETGGKGAEDWILRGEKERRSSTRPVPLFSPAPFPLCASRFREDLRPGAVVFLRRDSVLLVGFQQLGEPLLLGLA